MKTEKQLSALKDTFAQKYPEINSNVSLEDFFGTVLQSRFANFVGFLKVEHTEEEVSLELAKVTPFVVYANDTIRLARLKALKAMPYQSAYADYLKDQSVKGYAIKEGEEDNSFTLAEEEAISLDPYDFFCYMSSSAEKQGLINACCILCDNVARFVTNSNNEKATIVGASLKPDYVEMRKKHNWGGKVSKNSLTSELNDVAKLLAGDSAPVMIKADVTFLIHGIIQSKSEMNKAGCFVKRDEKTVIRFVFRAMYTRANKLAYSFQDKTLNSKEDKRTETAKGSDVTTNAEPSLDAAAKELKKRIDKAVKDAVNK